MVGLQAKPLSELLMQPDQSTVYAVGMFSLFGPPKESAKGNLGFWLTLRDAGCPPGVRVGYYRKGAVEVYEQLRAVPEEKATVMVTGELSVKAGEPPTIFADSIVPAGLLAADYIPQPRIPVEESWAEIEAAVRKLPEGGVLRRLTDCMLACYGKEIRTWAAAKAYHQPTVGGLAEHICRMLRLAEYDIEEYGAPEPYPSRLRAGVLWHDIGKIFTYAPPPGNEVLPAESLIPHSLAGCLVVIECARSEGLWYKWRFEPDIQALVHMIASHHGTQAWGALCEPKTPEARALHAIDAYEAKRSHSELARLSNTVAYDEVAL